MKMTLWNAHTTIGGILDSPDDALEMRSSKSSKTASEIGACRSMSTGLPHSSAHLRLATPSGVDLWNTVESDVITSEEDRYGGIVCSLSPRLKGTASEMIEVVLSLDRRLRIKALDL
jgi:hypothetical protein